MAINRIKRNIRKRKLAYAFIGLLGIGYISNFAYNSYQCYNYIKYNKRTIFLKNMVEKKFEDLEEKIKSKEEFDLETLKLLETCFELAETRYFLIKLTKWYGEKFEYHKKRAINPFLYINDILKHPEKDESEDSKKHEGGMIWV